ncbi:MAG: NIPSNAP family protein [Alphaproteobacteria bacterium]|nr:NIPSNAP family protein [Alphaproteobacteria bacterium]
MIVDARTYTVKPGQLPAYLKSVEEEGYPLQQKHGFDLAGYFTVETGGLNKVVHYWKWENAKVRQETRAALYADKDWTAYRKGNAERIVEQENRLLAATDVVEPFAFMGNGSDMGFVDERTYTITYPQVPQFIEITKKLAKPIVERAGWQLIGDFTSITGTINQVVHLWYWDSHAQREERRPPPCPTRTGRSTRPPTATGWSCRKTGTSSPPPSRR